MKYEFFMQLKATKPLGIGKMLGYLDHYAPQAVLEFLSMKQADRILAKSTVITNKLRKLYETSQCTRPEYSQPAGFDPKNLIPI